ncbi:hypothetical protein L9F63_001055, partial [Diploptera punctata]
MNGIHHVLPYVDNVQENCLNFDNRMELTDNIQQHQNPVRIGRQCPMYKQDRSVTLRSEVLEANNLAKKHTVVEERVLRSTYSVWQKNAIESIYIIGQGRMRKWAKVKLQIN